MLCATCDKRRTISHCLRNYRGPSVPLSALVFVLQSTMWPRLFAKTKPTSGIDGAGTGAGPGKWTTTWVGTMGESNPLLLFKLYRKLPSKTQTNCRKYNCNSTFHARGYLGGMGNSSGMWQCGWQMRKRERERDWDCVPYHYSLENSTRPNTLVSHLNRIARQMFFWDS